MNVTRQALNFALNVPGQPILKRIAIMNNALLSFVRSSVPLNSQPVILQVEPTSRCNLDCIMCVRKTLAPFGDMQLEQYTRLLDSMPLLHGLWLQGQGEPLLHKDIIEFVHEAKARGISPMVITNGTLLTAKMSKDLNEAGLDELGISFNSTDKKTYESIMRGAKYENVIGNILAATHMINRRMKVFFSVTLMKENEHDVANIIQLAETLGIDEVVIRPLAKGGDYAGDYVKEHYPSVKDIAKSNKVKVTFRDSQKCRWPWQSMYVAWNGNVMPCCHILKYKALELGNIFENPNTWMSMNYFAFRQRMLNKSSDICKGCRLYENDA